MCGKLAHRLVPGKGAPPPIHCSPHLLDLWIYPFPERRGDLNTGRPRLAIAFACPALLTLSGDYDDLTLMHEFTHALVGVGITLCVGI